ncbi:Transcriptional activator spt7 [Nowakowskiella sp. JEL0078]|nr:Transcriptional activator spt7 [Nowakowskiella sp. JEL0078]
MAYNTMPDSPYRKKASAMKRKSTELMKKVPDIVILTRESDSDDEKDGTDYQDDFQALERPGSEPAGGFGDEAATTEYQENSSATTTEYLEQSKVGLKAPSGTDKMDIDVKIDLKCEPQGPDDYIDEGDVQLIRWKKATMATRVELTKLRKQHLALKFCDRPTLARTASDVTTYLTNLRNFRIRNLKRRTHNYNTSGLGDASRQQSVEWFLPELMERQGTVPEIVGGERIRVGYRSMHCVELFDPQRADMMKNTASLSDYAESRAPEGSALDLDITRNISELKQIKEIQSKILTREAGFDDYPLPPSMPPYLPNPANTVVAPFLLNRRGAESVLRQVIARLLAHAGFDNCDSSALETLLEIGAQQILNMGKVLRLYIDRFGKTMNNEEILMHTMKENGIANVRALDSYIRHDVQRYSNKLYELRRKMAYAYRDMIGVKNDLPTPLHQRKEKYLVSVFDPQTNKLKWNITYGEYQAANTNMLDKIAAFGSPSSSTPQSIHSKIGSAILPWKDRSARRIDAHTFGRPDGLFGFVDKENSK